MKLAIGTAQFGLDYGVSNQNGQVSQHDVEQILKAAQTAGVQTLDTASDYGNSELSLGLAGINSFEVVTKFGVIPQNTIDIKRWVFEKIEGSISRLKVGSLHGCLMHSPSDLLGPNGDNIYAALLESKAQGLTKNIGISIYSPIELDELSHRFEFDIIQAPMNIFDRRLDSSGWLARLTKSNTQIHIRSVFLQGLLLMDTDSRPEYFSHWASLFDKYDSWLACSPYSAIESCIGFIQQFESVGKIIVGIASLSQLEGIIKGCSNNALLRVPNDLYSDDIKLINPAKWSL